MGLLLLPLNFSHNDSNELTTKITVEKAFSELEFGRPLETAMINNSILGSAPFTMGAVLIPGVNFNGDIFAKVIKAAGTDSYLEAIEIQLGGVIDKIFVHFGSKITYSFLQNWQTDATIIILRYGFEGKLKNLFAADATTLLHYSCNLLKNSTSKPLLKIDLS